MITKAQTGTAVEPQRVPVEALGERLGLDLTAPRSATPLEDWSMRADDGPILEAVFRAFAPRRHLEFGTWEGFGARLVLQACGATVWTLNLPEGEVDGEGNWQYAGVYDDASAVPAGAGAPQDFRSGGGHVYFQTDAHGFIGRLYREAGLGHRVNQVFCDSQAWDTSAYPAGFFDSVLVDGGHEPAVVVSDTCKAMPLLRSGGLMLWHDYCPEPAVLEQGGAAAGVFEAIRVLGPDLREACQDWFWVEPSHLLIGVRR